MRTVFAHVGNATDNAITTQPNGDIDRTFMAFNSHKEFVAYQDRVWVKSGNTRNVIACDRQTVERHKSKGFYISPEREIWSSKALYQAMIAL